MKKRLILCTLVMVLFFSVDAFAASKFKDVKETAWYYKYLVELSNAKVIDGMPDGTFQGTGTLNADQLLKLMVTTVNPRASYERTLGQKEDGTIVELDKWFDPYLNVLQSMSLIEPIEEEVDTGTYKYKQTINLNASYYNKPISREEVAYWVEKGYSFLRIKIHEYDKASDETIKEAIFNWYKDASTIDEKYYKAIYILHESGIMEGSDDGCFWPKKVLTRAEATAVIYRLQKARYVEIEQNNMDFSTDATRVDYVIRTKEDGTREWQKVLIKNGYVYSDDGWWESSAPVGTVIKQVTTREIDLTNFPLVDDPDTDEWGEDMKDFTEEEKQKIKEMLNMNN